MQHKLGAPKISDDNNKITAAIYLQVSIISQALIFVTRSRSWSFVERPGALLMIAFVIAQAVSILHCQLSSDFWSISGN
jgi:H+-transporting ATPase